MLQAPAVPIIGTKPGAVLYEEQGHKLNLGTVVSDPVGTRELSQLS